MKNPDVRSVSGCYGLSSKKLDRIFQDKKVQYSEVRTLSLADYLYEKAMETRCTSRNYTSIELG